MPRRWNSPRSEGREKRKTRDVPFFWFWPKKVRTKEKQKQDMSKTKRSGGSNGGSKLAIFTMAKSEHSLKFHPSKPFTCCNLFKTYSISIPLEKAVEGVPRNQTANMLYAPLEAYPYSKYPLFPGYVLKTDRFFKVNTSFCSGST